MTRRTIGLLVTLTLGFLAAPLALPAPPPATVNRIGFLCPRPAHNPRAVQNLESFRQGLRDLGYVEGQHLTIAYRSAEDDQSRLPDLAAELVRLPVDVIVTYSTPAIHAAKQATSTIPIVMAVSGDPVGTGFIASLARPGGNITGFTGGSVRLAGKRLELLKELVPEVSRIAVLWNPTNPGVALEWEATQEAARALGVRLYSLEVRRPDEFAPALANAQRAHAQALIVTGESLFGSHLPQLTDLVAKSRLPAVYSTPGRATVEAGGLMAYTANASDMFRRAATYVVKILHGAKPAELPVEEPMRFELAINLKTAQAMGLTVRPILLFQADEVIR
jgi:putative tryptophan/tyrosine transport system substrate-binding protein